MDGRKRVRTWGFEGGMVFEGKEGAEAVGERGVFRAESVAERRDGVGGCRLRWGVKRGLCYCIRGSGE